MSHPESAHSRQSGPSVLIVGAGFGGLCMAIRLKQSGFDNFILLEKGSDIGGTWRDNQYPGACCDTKAFAYCYSFEQKTDWSAKWVPWHEILAYMRHCVAKYGLQPHLRLDTEVAAAHFDDRQGRWEVRTASGEILTADVLISSVGQLNRPAVPDIPGREDFAGPAFHSARWDEDVDVAGRRVGVIGNAASAIQFIPELATGAREVHVFQRSANWMIERGNRPVTDFEKRLYARSRWLARLHRAWVWAYYECLIYPMILGWPGFRQAGVWMARRALSKQVRDPALRQALVPDYPIGAKRILVSDDYYAALTRPNVHLHVGGIDHIHASGLTTGDGRHHELDLIVYGTGFKSTEFLAPMDIHGRGGVRLSDRWADRGAEAYLGMSVPGFPNFFMLYGPNTNLGHYSIIFMLERQANYVLQCIRALAGRPRGETIEVREDVCEAFNERLQTRLRKMTWSKVDHSWYMDRGRITNNWPGSTTEYWWRTRRVRPGDYVWRPLPETPGEVAEASLAGG